MGYSQMIEAQTEWVKPTEFPDLRQADTIAIDLETHDPDLKSKGSGSVVGRGKVVGIAVAADGYSGYFPFDHEGGGNLEKSKVIQWFTDICQSSADKIFHNAMYDVCWIRAMGIEIKGKSPILLTPKEVLKQLKKNDPDKKLRKEGKLPPLKIINKNKNNG